MVVSYIKVNEKTYSLEALSERFVHIPTRKFVEIFRHNNVVLPRLLRMILLRKYLTPCIHDPETNSYFSKELMERLQYYEYFTEYQLEELLALLKEDIDYTLYVKDFWLDVLGMKDVLEISSGLLDLLDSQVDESFAEYNILTFNILTSHIFGDKYGFIDGVSSEQLRMILKKSATVTTLRNIAKKYNVSLPQGMSRNFFANLIVAKYKEEPQYKAENIKSLADASIEALEEFASERNYEITSSDELGLYVEYVLLKAHVRTVNDIVYSGYVLSKKNTGSSFGSRLSETKSSESILDGNHVQLYTSHEEAFEDFEYDESLVAKMQTDNEMHEDIEHITSSSLDIFDNKSEDDEITLDNEVLYEKDDVVETENEIELLSIFSDDYSETDTSVEEIVDDVINSASLLIDLEDGREDLDEFESLFAETMSMDDAEPKVSGEYVENRQEIINLSDEIKNINTVLSGRKEENVIFGQIEEQHYLGAEIEIQDESEIEGGVETEDDTEIEIEDLNLKDDSLTDLDLDFDSSGATPDAIEQFRELGNNLDFDNRFESGELFLDEVDEGFSSIGVNAPEFDRVITLKNTDEVDEELSDINDDAQEFNRVVSWYGIDDEFTSMPNSEIQNGKVEGVSQDLIIGQLGEIKFDYDELDATEARQINDSETVSNLMYTIEASEAITVEDDSYDLDLDMEVDLSHESSKNNSGIDYNRVPELSVKVDNMEANVFDIDVELPSDAVIPDSIGNEEESIQKSATLDDEFERFLREVDELETTSILEFDDELGKYKFEVSEDDIHKLKKGGKTSTSSLDEDELLAALSDLD